MGLVVVALEMTTLFSVFAKIIYARARHTMGIDNRMKNALIYFSLIAVFLLIGCALAPPDKTVSIYIGHNNYARFELPQENSECKEDSVTTTTKHTTKWR